MQLSGCYEDSELGEKRRSQGADIEENVQVSSRNRLSYFFKKLLENAAATNPSPIHTAQVLITSVMTGRA
jgi:hypothetical protein